MGPRAQDSPGFRLSLSDADDHPLADLAACAALDPLGRRITLMGRRGMLETDMEHLVETEPDPMELVIATAEGAILLRIDLRGRQKLSLGRSRKCDVRLSGPGISRHHAVLFEEAGRWMLLATSPRNGVWMDRERVTATALAPDRALRIGELYLWFFGRSEEALIPPRVSPYPAPMIALRSEYIESLWRSRALRPAAPIHAPSRAA